MVGSEFKVQSSKLRVVSFIFVLAVLSLTGCANLMNRGNGPMATLEPQANLRFSDIPVPAGFKPLDRDSYNFESSGVRVGVLKYQGKANPEQVVNFYKEQMPMYNWNLLNVVEYGERMLNFDRELETCVVRLSGNGNKVIITVSLGPKSQITKKAAKTAVK